MRSEKMNNDDAQSVTEDMLADLRRGHLPLAGDSDIQTDQLRELLGEVADLAREVPEPSNDLRALLEGSVPLRSRRPAAGRTPRLRGIVVVATGALALGGVSAAAAANRLPDRVQEVVADATGGVVPHPVKPTDPPFDAPGHVSDKPKATTTPEPAEAPGQIQKLTKPDPTSPGPAHPADPGSHGRAHNPDEANDNPSSRARPGYADGDDSGLPDQSDRPTGKPNKD